MPDYYSLIIAKLRNIVYYRLNVEPLDPERRRCQYMHILRILRSDIKKYLEIPGRPQQQVDILKGILKIIPRGVTNSQAFEVILNLQKYVKS